MTDQLVYQGNVTNETTSDPQNQEWNASRKAYQMCIEKLNSLQPLTRELPEAGVITRSTDVTRVKSMVQYLTRCGVSMEDINRIPIIHVAGTKGKGSVCVFSESVLRKYGLKTGLFTSPHLIEVRERFPIDGKPIDYNKFVRYFSEVFYKLEDSKEEFGQEMPVYKQILCVMGFYVFLKEKVDVAVIEVGLGGQYDVTNFIREPIVTGISSLGLDHVELLGNTIAEIAWHKAGILKPGKPAFTVPRPEDAMKVILDRAKEIGTTVQCVPSFEIYDLGKHPLKLGIPGKYQQANASLVIQLCRKFLETTKNTNDAFRGLRECYWPGRSQRVVRDRVTYYLDGAHTERSIKCCVEWFVEVTREEEARTNGRTAKMLVFNLKSQKYKPSLIRPLLNCGFTGAAFCPSYINDGENPADQSFLANKRHEEFCNSQNIKQKYEDLDAVLRKSFFDGRNTNKFQSLQVAEKGFSDPESSKFSFRDHAKPTKCVALPSISAALRWASAGKDALLDLANIQDSEILGECLVVDRIQVLITGSLYLVGGALQLLDPKLATGIMSYK
ncbi:Folylpolyglutamate synthase, mitochondrial [Holothuria leucospilota]|uniref:Folylpolyglutamate synthase n=1 Tax=Holothuria leucospilota TaxID=206669 RepID=A0A9Q1HA26_HOLLE|nr:Folylpolyglutamate synthase, mitochondrial [Holothuria leucospilota]